MPDLLDDLALDAEIEAAVEHAAGDAGVPPTQWLRALVTEHLRRTGYLPETDEGLRPDELNANNDG